MRNIYEPDCIYFMRRSRRRLAEEERVFRQQRNFVLTFSFFNNINYIFRFSLPGEAVSDCYRWNITEERPYDTLFHFRIAERQRQRSVLFLKSPFPASLRLKRTFISFNFGGGDWTSARRGAPVDVVVGFEAGDDVCRGRVKTKPSSYCFHMRACHYCRWRY